LAECGFHGIPDRMLIHNTIIPSRYARQSQHDAEIESNTGSGSNQRNERNTSFKSECLKSGREIRDKKSKTKTTPPPAKKPQVMYKKYVGRKAKLGKKIQNFVNGFHGYV